jgi:protein TonB
MVRRASWIGALVLSIAAHGAVVAAFTPDPNEAIEAGSGAGSSIEGSIDATLGSDVAIENLASEELKTALDTEIAPAVEPTELAALVPSPTETEPTQPTQTAVAPAETQAIEAAAVSELTETQPSAIVPALAADISATPIESDLPAAPSTELSEIVPTETLTAVAPTTSATPETLPAATSAAEAKPVERPIEKPMQTAVLTAIKPVETAAPQEIVPEELVPLPEAKPVEVTPVEKQEETKPVEAKREAPRPVEKKLAEKAEPTRKPAREKAEKADKKQKAQAPRRGDAEADSDRGASVASRELHGPRQRHRTLARIRLRRRRQFQLSGQGARQDRACDPDAQQGAPPRHLGPRPCPLHDHDLGRCQEHRAGEQHRQSDAR